MVEKYMQNGQLLQLKGHLQEQLSFFTSLQFDQDFAAGKLKALVLDMIHNIAVMVDLLNHRTGQNKDSGEDEEFVIAKTDFLLAVCR